eukprot:6172667-Pleurochrysis_carterae.AAC.8
MQPKKSGAPVAHCSRCIQFNRIRLLIFILSRLEHACARNHASKMHELSGQQRIRFWYPTVTDFALCVRTKWGNDKSERVQRQTIHEHCGPQHHHT